MKSEFKNPEFKLLLAIARSKNDLDNFISEHQIDWDYLLELAFHHGMLPILHLGLNKSKEYKIPAKVTDHLKNFYFENTQSNILLLGNLVKLLQLLDEAKIEVVPFKGILLSKDLYQGYTIRQAGDIDILVKPKDVPKVIEILETQGYEKEHPFSKNQQIALAKISREKHFRMNYSKKSLVIEIHWRVYTQESIGEPELDFFWDNLKNTTLQNVESKTFRPEVMLMYLCFHAYRHLWRRLFWLWEIDQFIKNKQNLNWNWILENSRKFGSENVIFLSLLVVHDAFGTEIPQLIWDQIKTNQHVQQLFSQIKIEPERFDLEVDQKIDFLNIKDMTRIHNNLLNRANQFMRFAFTPNHFDILTFDFHPTLHFLYFLLRPFRLLFTTARQLFMPSK